MNSPYFETLQETITAAFSAATDSQALFATLSDENASAQERLEQPMSYNELRTADFAITMLRNRPTKKYFHVVITRLDSGRYELVTYIL